MSECEKCHGTGWEVEEKTRSVRKCECRRAAAEAQALERAGIPPRYQTKSLESYDTKVGKSAFAAHGICRRFVDEFPMNPGRGILLSGGVGLGKTHLAIATLLACRSRYNSAVAFVDLPELLSRIKATFHPDAAMTEEAILRPLLRAELLAIDEIGAARSTEWAFAMTENIINQRYNSNASTIFTTNFANMPPAVIMQREAAAAPGPKRATTLDPATEPNFAERMRQPMTMPIMRQETLGDRIGERMFSRLQEMCWILEMTGTDQRRATAARGSR